MAQWVKSNGLDGIDVDYEDLTAMNRGDGAAEKWVSDFTTTLRQTLPQGQYILSHAPLAPWLSPNAQFAAGAYVTVNKNVGQLIDFVSLSLLASHPCARIAVVCCADMNARCSLVQHPVLQPGSLRGL